MKPATGALLAVAFATIGTTSVYAEDPSENSNIQQKPPVMVPNNSSDQGAGSGDAGYSTPAGNPSDPTTDENVQPGPSTHGPTDPAAGSNAGARIPTSPPGTGSSSP